jgi:hypothetical protein
MEAMNAELALPSYNAGSRGNGGDGGAVQSGTLGGAAQQRRVAKGAVIAIVSIVAVVALAACVVSIVACFREVIWQTSAADVPLSEIRDALHVRLVPQTRVSGTKLPSPVTRVPLSNYPIVDMLFGVVTHSEAAHLRALATAVVLERAQSGRGATYRTVTLLPKERRHKQDETLDMVEERLAALAGVPVTYLEPLEVMVFAAGDQKRDGTSFFTPGGAEEQAVGQRTVSILVHLNTLVSADGGATMLPYLGQSIVPEEGKALLWHNVTETGHVDARSVHGSAPMASDTPREKYVLMAHFRDKPLSYVAATTFHNTMSGAKFRHFTYDQDGDILAPV